MTDVCVCWATAGSCRWLSLGPPHRWMSGTPPGTGCRLVIPSLDLLQMNLHIITDCGSLHIVWPLYIPKLSCCWITLVFLLLTWTEEEQQELEFWKQNQPKANSQGKLFHVLQTPQRLTSDVQRLFVISDMMMIPWPKICYCVADPQSGLDARYICQIWVPISESNKGNCQDLWLYLVLVAVVSRIISLVVNRCKLGVCGRGTDGVLYLRAEDYSTLH